MAGDEVLRRRLELAFVGTVVLAQGGVGDSVAPKPGRIKRGLALDLDFSYGKAELLFSQCGPRRVFREPRNNLGPDKIQFFLSFCLAARCVPPTQYNMLLNSTPPETGIRPYSLCDFIICANLQQEENKM